jgi:hypothetical protein
MTVYTILCIRPNTDHLNYFAIIQIPFFNLFKIRVISAQVQSNNQLVTHLNLLPTGPYRILKHIRQTRVHFWEIVNTLDPVPNHMEPVISTVF